MPTFLTQQETLDMFFLEMRSRVLELAAGLDRLDFAHAESDPQRTASRQDQLKHAVGALLDEAPQRTQRIQLIFSDPYDAAWRTR